jgi:hypothetical protein
MQAWITPSLVNLQVVKEVRCSMMILTNLFEPFLQALTQHFDDVLQM